MKYHSMLISWLIKQNDQSVTEGTILSKKLTPLAIVDIITKNKNISKVKLPSVIQYKRICEIKGCYKIVKVLLGYKECHYSLRYSVTAQLFSVI